jgi:hypothetical protein
LKRKSLELKRKSLELKRKSLELKRLQRLPEAPRGFKSPVGGTRGFKRLQEALQRPAPLDGRIQFPPRGPPL